MNLAKKSFSAGEFENRIAKRVHIDSGAALEAAKKGNDMEAYTGTQRKKQSDSLKIDHKQNGGGRKAF